MIIKGRAVRKNSSTQVARPAYEGIIMAEGHWPIEGPCAHAHEAKRADARARRMRE